MSAVEDEIEELRARALRARLLARDEAAAYLGQPLRSFARHIQPQLRHLEIRVGTRVYYDRRDLDQWLELQKGGGCANRGAPATATTFASRSPVRARKPSDPRAREILKQLTDRRRSSTPKLFLVGSPKGERDRPR
jgi:hypothetical protein